MKKWYSFLDVLSFPLKMLFIALICYGIGNILVSPTYEWLFVIKNDYIRLCAEAIMRISQFFIVYFPIICLFRLVSRRINGVTTIITGLIGYVTFLVFTVYFQMVTMPSYAYASILGISVTNSTITSIASSIKYPLQTGLIGVIIVTVFTRIAYKQSRKRLANGFMSFIDKDILAVLLNTLYCALAGIGFAILWPKLFNAYYGIIEFIAKDSTNPINLTIYGILDRTLSVLNLGSLIRQPFWFRAMGGSVMNMVGESIVGDVNMWNAVVNNGVVSLQAGKYITPYYVLNIFAIPAMLIAFSILNTDKIERRKYRVFFLIAILASMFTNILVPVEIVLLLLCPVLFIFHLIYSGMLFGLFHIMGVYLGYLTTNTNVIAAPCGTFLEWLTYFNNINYKMDATMVLIVGVISFIIYFVVTLLYFNFLASDMFNTGKTERIAKGMIEAVGGGANIKMIYSSINHLTVQVFDSTLINPRKMQALGAVKLYETKAGFIIDYGCGSRIISKAMNKELRKSIR